MEIYLPTKFSEHSHKEFIVHWHTFQALRDSSDFLCSEKWQLNCLTFNLNFLKQICVAEQKEMCKLNWPLQTCKSCQEPLLEASMAE